MEVDTTEKKEEVNISINIFMHNINLLINYYYHYY